jgi:hypothetical protein
MAQAFRGNWFEPVDILSIPQGLGMERRRADIHIER